MIYTLTINPALDYIIEIQNFKLSNINRSEKEYIFPGGKGINVSIVLFEFCKDLFRLAKFSLCYFIYPS